MVWNCSRLPSGQRKSGITSWILWGKTPKNIREFVKQAAGWFFIAGMKVNLSWGGTNRTHQRLIDSCACVNWTCLLACAHFHRGCSVWESYKEMPNHNSCNKATELLHFWGEKKKSAEFLHLCSRWSLPNHLEGGEQPRQLWLHQCQPHREYLLCILTVCSTPPPCRAPTVPAGRRTNKGSLPYYNINFDATLA